MKKALIYSAIVASLLIGCGGEKREDTKTSTLTEQVQKQESTTQQKSTKQESTQTPKVEEKSSGVKKVVTEATKKAEEKVQKVREATKEVVQKVEQKAKEVKKVATEVAQKAQEKASNLVASATSAVQNIAQKAKEAVAPKEDGKKLYISCAGCHGAKAEKKALGASKVIAGWDANKVEEALKGYKAGTYGGAMKGVMQGQAAKLNEAQIKALAKYISTLK